MPISTESFLSIKQAPWRNICADAPLAPQTALLECSRNVPCEIPA